MYRIHHSEKILLIIFCFNQDFIRTGNKHRDNSYFNAKILTSFLMRLFVRAKMDASELLDHHNFTQN